MPKENTTPSKIKFYKTTWFPWMIILFMVTAVSFLITGWFLAKADNNRVTSEANVLIQPIVNQLKK